MTQMHNKCLSACHQPQTMSKCIYSSFSEDQNSKRHLKKKKNLITYTKIKLNINVLKMDISPYYYSSCLTIQQNHSPIKIDSLCMSIGAHCKKTQHIQELKQKIS